MAFHQRMIVNIFTLSLYRPPHRIFLAVSFSFTLGSFFSFFYLFPSPSLSLSYIFALSLSPLLYFHLPTFLSPSSLSFPCPLYLMLYTCLCNTRQHFITCYLYPSYYHNKVHLRVPSLRMVIFNDNSPRDQKKLLWHHLIPMSVTVRLLSVWKWCHNTIIVTCMKWWRHNLVTAIVTVL